jgi:anti-sigma factor RsiW
VSDIRHYSDELQLLLDGRLDVDTTRLVETHLRGCAACRTEQQELFALRESLRALGDATLPSGLPERIRAALDAESAPPGRLGAAPAATTRKSMLWRAAGGLAALALAVFATVQWNGPEPGIVDVARAVMSFEAGSLPLDIRTTVPVQVEAEFRAHGIRFAPRVFDLQMMGYQLVGGATTTLAGTTSTLFVYRGRGDQYVLCQMFEGIIDSFIRNAAVEERNGIRFYVHRRGKVTEVFWAEGGVICVLASTAESASVIALAIAKAMKV